MNSQNETVSLGKRQIRIIRDSKGGIQRFCLNDLCAFLGREIIRPNQDVTKVCPQSVKLPFKINGHRMWSITPAEIKTLTAAVIGETPGSVSRCRTLEEWVDSLQNPSAPVAQIESPQPVIIYYQERIPVSFRKQDNRVWINATQLTKGFHRQPIEWLRLKDTIRLRSELAAEGKTGNVEQQIIAVRGRNNGATWMVAPLALELALWLDAEFFAWCSDRVEELTQSDTYSPSPEPLPVPENQPTPPVIPAKGKKSKNDFLIPQTFSEALKLAAQLQERIEQNQHKVNFYEELIENRDWFTTTRIADELRTTAYQLNEFLNDRHICRFENKEWVAYQEYHHLRVDVPYFRRDKRGKFHKTRMVSRWNQQGREFIIDLWKTHHPVSHE